MLEDFLSIVWQNVCCISMDLPDTSLSLPETSFDNLRCMFLCKYVKMYQIVFYISQIVYYVLVIVNI